MWTRDVYAQVKLKLLCTKSVFKKHMNQQSDVIKLDIESEIRIPFVI